MEAAEQLVDTWVINDKLNRFLLKEVGPDRLATPLAKGKSVAAQFAHIHNVRLMWIKVSLPEAYDALAKLEAAAVSEETIENSLAASGGAIAQLLRKSAEAGGRIKGFKPHSAAFVGYLIAHESNHRGQIELALRQAGTPLSDKASYRLWEWGS